MRVVIQRVQEAAVVINQEVHARIGLGLLVLLGIENGDQEEDTAWLCGKITRLRIFPDPNGTMNLGLGEAGGEILLVSQFTLHASTHKGNRPSYSRAAPPAIAEPIYRRFIERLALECGRPIQSGVFGADMKVHLVNDGPVTIIIDSKLRE